MSSHAAVYLVTGDDEHLVQREVDDLLGELRDRIPDLDVDVVDAADAEGLPELRTATLFGGTRCVVVRGTESVRGQLAKEVDAYLEDPEDEAIFVLAARTRGRLSGRLATAAELGERRDVSTPAPWDERGWDDLVREELRRCGRDGDRGAIAAILERAGLDAASIASKTAQVAAATDEGARVSAADVEQVVEGHGSRGAFAVADAIVSRDPSAAILAVRGVLEAGDAPLAVLGAVTHRFRQLLQVRAGERPKGVSDGRMYHLERESRQFRPGELAWCQDRLARTDLDLKSSDLPPEVVLEIAVIDLATARDVGAPWNPAAAARH